MSPKPSVGAMDRVHELDGVDLPKAEDRPKAADRDHVSDAGSESRRMFSHNQSPLFLE